MRRVGLVFVIAFASSAIARAQSPTTELSAIAYGVSATRDAILTATSVGSGSGTMTGGELSARFSWAGIMVRLVNGAVPTAGSSAASLTTGEARLLLGARAASLDVGYAVRAVGGALGSTTYSYLRAGGSTILDLGGTGASARASAAVYFGGQGAANAEVSGQEITAALEYRIGGTPFVLTAGYRAEVFQTATLGVVRAEHLSGLLVGGGLRFTR